MRVREFPQLLRSQASFGARWSYERNFVSVAHVSRATLRALRYPPDPGGRP